MAVETIASYTPEPGCCLLTERVLPLSHKGSEGPGVLLPLVKD